MTLTTPTISTSTSDTSDTSRAASDVKEQVRSRYGAIAASVAEASSGACGSSCCDEPSRTDDPITSNLYDVDQLETLPEGAILASLGCGNPTALIDLRPGETVLDLGSGGGIDVLLSAKRVGPTGFAYGLDMTDEMLALAERNAAEQGVSNVQFLKGEIERIPLPDNSVDVVISNCVINLSSDKGQVLREAFRVLKPGGRFAVSDVVVQGNLPPALKQSMELWAGCIAGALEEGTYRDLLSAAGFQDISVQVTRVYDAEALGASLESSDEGGEATDGCCGPTEAAQLEAFEAFSASGGQLVSAFVRAVKPAV
ncbi:MAG TPA: arsenite methyltransferase [Chloroflexota bacterium]|nr:arsenite methyltransferase [Chloroflexota bacterium]